MIGGKLLRASSIVLLVGLSFAVSASGWWRPNVLVCGGSHYERESRGEVITSSFSLFNFNSSGTLTIDDILVVDANGVELFNGLPVEHFKPILGPMQSTWFWTPELLGEAYLSTTERPLQVHIRWSSNSRRGEGLSGSVNVIVREGVIGPEKARFGLRCHKLGKS